MENIRGLIDKKREETLGKLTKVGKTSERLEIVKEITECVAKTTTSKKKLNSRTIGVLLNYLKTPDLYVLHSVCKQARNYAALFWYHVKPKKQNN